MNSNRRLILTTISILSTLIAVARAGFAERWEENWVKDFFFAGTIFAVQSILFIAVLIIDKKRALFSNLFMPFCKKIAGNRYLQVLIGGLLLSVNIGIYVDTIFGGLFIFGPLIFLGLMILNFILAFSPQKIKWLSNPKLLYYLLVLLIIAPIGVIVYHYAIEWSWFDNLYSYEMIIDYGCLATVTIKPVALPHHFFYHILIYSIALYIPLVAGLVTKLICNHKSSLFPKK